MEFVFLLVDILGLLFFWNLVGLMFVSSEGFIIQLIMVVLYGSLVMLGFMLYSNGGGSVIVLSLLLLVSFVSYTVDYSLFVLLVILMLLVVVL